MAHQAAVLDLNPRLGTLELREALSSSFFGARHRLRAPSSGRSGAHALGTSARHSGAAQGAELLAVRVVRADGSKVIERLALAATAARSAEHPALLAPLQIVRERDRLGVVTSDIAGVTLSELVEQLRSRGEGLPQAIGLRIALDCLAGLHALEAAMSGPDAEACLYGGLTPDSIHVGRDGQTRVIDPGVMAAAARQVTWADERRMLAYTAPEVHGSRGPRYDARSDTFAIGIVLWELLSGQPLFLAPTARETITQVRDARVVRLRRERFVRGEPIMASVANVVARALEREPSRRFQSYSELAVALRDAAPAAELEQVAAFVAGLDVTSLDAPTQSTGFEEPERVTARVHRLDRPEDTTKVPAVTANASAAELASSDVAEVTPAGSLSQPRVFSAKQRTALWVAVGMVVLATVFAFALRSQRRVDQASEPDTQARPTVQPVAQTPRAIEPAAPVVTPEPQPAAQPTPPSPPVTATPRPAARKARPPARLNAEKRPFIPDDI